MTKDGAVVNNARSDDFNFRDLLFIVGIDMINEFSTGFRNSGCDLNKLLKPEENGSIIPSGGRGGGGGCLKRSMLKSPKSKMVALHSVTLSIILVKSPGHPSDYTGFLYTYPTSNGFVLESFISTQMHSIASFSRSNLRLTLFSIDLWTYRARPVCKG